MSGGLDRYREMVADWREFVRVARSPEPTTIRWRRPAGPSIRDQLRRQGFELETIGGMPRFFRMIREPFPVSKTLEHWLGDFYIQQASAGVAAMALGAGPGDRVLDLCAAPGGKTTHVADAMGSSGMVVAVDSDTNRIRALLANVYRMGHPNVLVAEADGRTFPGGALFDRVLVDVPCSGEGNVRRHGGEIRRRSDSFTAHITSVQKDLLSRALALVRPGGVVLYTTCTFAPEENEAVVDEVLGSGGAVLEPIDLDLPHAPGLTSFRGRAYRDDLSLAWRIYPHHLDSGGLFLARIRRSPGATTAGSERGSASKEPATRETGSEGSDEGSEGGSGWAPIPERFPDAESGAAGRASGDGVGGGSGKGRGDQVDDGARDAARERIGKGVEGALDHFGLETPLLPGRVPVRWIVRGDSVWVHGCSHWPVPAWDPAGDWRVLSLGIRALKGDPRTTWGERPTSDFLRVVEKGVRRRVVDLGEEEILDVLDRRPATVGEPGRGFVGLRFRGRILGRGWVKDGVLSNEIPKARSQRLRADLRTARKAEEKDQGKTERGEEGGTGGRP